MDYGSKQFEEEDLLRALNVLKPLAKTIFNLYAIEGYKHKEIGELLQISEGASKTHLSRARKILQNELQKTRGYESNTLDKIFKEGLHSGSSPVNPDVWSRLSNELEAEPKKRFKSYRYIALVSAAAILLFLVLLPIQDQMSNL